MWSVWYECRVVSCSVLLCVVICLCVCVIVFSVMCVVVVAWWCLCCARVVVNVDSERSSVGRAFDCSG